MDNFSIEELGEIQFKAQMSTVGEGMARPWIRVYQRLEDAARDLKNMKEIRRAADG